MSAPDGFPHSQAAPDPLEAGRVQRVSRFGAEEKLLAKDFETACLILDGDEAGPTAAAECVTRIRRRLWVRLADVPDGKQPDQLRGEELIALMRE